MKAVIPVAGLGTRFLPITKSVPKPMLPIIDKPALHYIVKEAFDSGIEEVILIVNKNQNNIEKYFAQDEELKQKLLKAGKRELYDTLIEIENLGKITIIEEETPNGNALTINLAKDLINEPFAVLYGDDLIFSDVPCLKQLIDIHEKTGGNVLGARKVSSSLVSNYGVFKLDEDKIISIVEKPEAKDAPSNLVFCGRAILNPEIFKEIEHLKPANNGEYQITDAMERMMTYQDFYPCIFTGKYFDIGSKLGFLEANNYCAAIRNMKGE